MKVVLCATEPRNQKPSKTSKIPTITAITLPNQSKSVQISPNHIIENIEIHWVWMSMVPFKSRAFGLSFLSFTFLNAFYQKKRYLLLLLLLRSSISSLLALFSLFVLWTALNLTLLKKTWTHFGAFDEVFVVASGARARILQVARSAVGRRSTVW